MVKLIKIFICFLLLVVFLPLETKAINEVKLYFFHSDTCGHCANEKIFLEELKSKYSNVVVIDYEVSDAKNSQLLAKVKKKLKEYEAGVNDQGVPFTLIGLNAFVGYSESVGLQIENAVKYASNNAVKDIVGEVLGRVSNVDNNNKATSEEFVLPFIGKINAKNISLPLVSIVIGLVDGFNPCAMWVLLFLISMLLGMNDKKKMWILGISFLVTSACVYLFFMMSWLQVAVSMTEVIWLRNIIAIVALSGGIINLKKYLQSKKETGCSVVDDQKRGKLFNKIKNIIAEQNFFLALIGIVALAASVNLIELACSAGLPLVFTQILAINNITGIASLGYTLLYVLFFLLDDLIVFTIAMVSLNITGISSKYNKYSHLIGGIIMLLVGFLLLFKPEWLMFNFS